MAADNQLGRGCMHNYIVRFPNVGRVSSSIA
jgi:hypothetical protein